uniref:Uncharacterized protein n=1 Tax=Candidatus Kentrum sp. DK TaxID=2126562 RepID=A0A450S8K4_9GAMM|nr:MAG: hypothetical protein BECKDK2373C_GA0170839_10214 [Candidatus Kentron sp. DK]
MVIPRRGPGRAMCSVEGFSFFPVDENIRKTVMLRGITPADEKRTGVGWISEAHPPPLSLGGCASLIHPTRAAPTCVAVHSLISFLLCETLRTLRLCGCNLFFLTAEAQSSQRSAEFAEERRVRRGAQSSQRSAEFAEERRVRRGAQSSQRSAEKRREAQRRKEGSAGFSVLG